MKKSEARDALIYLVEKYILEKDLQDRLIHESSDMTKPMLPVRGVIDEIIKHKHQVISSDDKELIDDLFYFFT